MAAKAGGFHCFTPELKAVFVNHVVENWLGSLRGSISRYRICLHIRLYVGEVTPEFFNEYPCVRDDMPTLTWHTYHNFVGSKLVFYARCGFEN